MRRKKTLVLIVLHKDVTNILVIKQAPAARPRRLDPLFTNGGAAPIGGLQPSLGRHRRWITVNPAGSSSHRAFATGALINLLNPKAYIFFLVVAPQFLNGEALGICSALILSVISVAIATAIHL